MHVHQPVERVVVELNDSECALNMGADLEDELNHCETFTFGSGSSTFEIRERRIKVADGRLVGCTFVVELQQKFHAYPISR